MQVLYKGGPYKVYSFSQVKKFCETSTPDLTVIALVKSKVEISQKFVTSECMNFIRKYGSGESTAV